MKKESTDSPQNSNVTPVALDNAHIEKQALANPLKAIAKATVKTQRTKDASTRPPITDSGSLESPVLQLSAGILLRRMYQPDAVIRILARYCRFFFHQ